MRGPVVSRLSVVALLLASCACSAGTDEPDRAGAGPQLQAASVYGRHSTVRGKVDVRIANEGEAPVEVERWQVRHPMFGDVAPVERPSTLVPDGVERIVPVPFGPARCDADDPAGAVVVLTVRADDGRREVAVPLVDREPGLLRAHRQACAVEALTATASVELVPPWVRDPDRPDALRTTLVLRRRTPGVVTVDEVRGNVLFSVEPPAAPPLGALPADRHEVRAPLVVRATRCDPHALIESKRSFTFPVQARLDGGEVTAVPVTVDAAGRAALQALLDDTCGAGPSA